MCNTYYVRPLFVAHLFFHPLLTRFLGTRFASPLSPLLFTFGLVLYTCISNGELHVDLELLSIWQTS